MKEEEFSNMWEYKWNVVKELGNSLCMLLSALVPAMSIFALYFMKSTVARLAAIAAMSFTFSLLMTVSDRTSSVDSELCTDLACYSVRHSRF